MKVLRQREDETTADFEVRVSKELSRTPPPAEMQVVYLNGCFVEYKNGEFSTEGGPVPALEMWQ